MVVAVAALDGYDLYLADIAELEQQDRDLRFRVLDGAVAVELELIAVAVLYLGTGCDERRDAVERLIGSWGRLRAPLTSAVQLWTFTGDRGPTRPRGLRM
jgi:hypothetical protein